MMAKPDSRSTLWLVHSNEIDGPKRVAELASAGYRVHYRQWSNREIVQAKAELPAAVLVDLSRTPSRGRDIAIAMRSHRVMLAVPFVVLGGSVETTAALREFLPDAIEAEWKRVAAVLRRAIGKPPSGARLLSVFAAYEKSSLAKKLGIKAKSIVAMQGAPRGFRGTLGEIPPGAKLVTATGEVPRDLTLWFVNSLDQLEGHIASMKQHAKSGALWVFWRKSPLANGSRMTLPVVRKTALDAGLMDFKVIRVDDNWAGMRFTLRREGTS
jgi:hypothetical protein